MKQRNPIVRDMIANPKRNAGRHTSHKTLVDIYDRGGQSAIYEYAIANSKDFEDAWTTCIPCEDETPTFDGVCAVCSERK